MSQSAEKYQSPFLNVSSFPRQHETIEEEVTVPADISSSSPFISVYEMGNEKARVDPESEIFVQFLGELHDEEFDKALFEIINEASELYENSLIHEYRDSPSQVLGAERMLTEHFVPLQRELETLLDSIADDLDKRDFEAMTEYEIEEFIDSYQFTEEINPNFENFGGWFKKKLKKASKWAKKKAKGLAARAFKAALKKIKRYLKPLLKKILTFAIGKLPKKYQGLANLLRKKLGYEIEEEVFYDEEQETTGDIGQIQQELDLLIANLVLTDDVTKHELLLAEITTESELPITDHLAVLESAREQFIEGILDLKEGEDPTQLVENFAPAIIWAVKLGLKFYGRPKLVKFLAKYIARLIKRYVGRKYALPLSKVIVDAGLRLVNLEATEQEAIHTAGGVVASIVEDTINEVAKLPEYILDDEELLEGFVLEAFEKAATRNLPEILPEETYIKRPNLRESKGLKGTWIHKLKRRKRSHKKYTRTIKTRLSYHKLRALKSFAEIPLSESLLDQYALSRGSDFEATAHLYEAIPGTTLPKICRNETDARGLGAGTYAYNLLHPLTPESAGILFGHPGLGRSMPGRYLENRRRIGVGQRFYYLEIPGAQLHMVPVGVSGSAIQMSQVCGLKLILDFSKQQIRGSLFISESYAQEIAIKLRQQLPAGSVITTLQPILVSAMKHVLSSEKVKIIHPAIPPQNIRSALLNLPPKLNLQLKNRLLDWLVNGLSEYFRQKSDGFIAATEDRSDGVTLNFKFDNPPSFPLLAMLLKGASVAINDINFSGDITQTHIKAVAGYFNE